MMIQICEYVYSCLDCVAAQESKYKPKVKGRGIPEGPFHRVSLDHFTVKLPGYAMADKTAEKCVNFLMIKDNFSKLMQVVVVRNQTAQETAK